MKTIRNIFTLVVAGSAMVMIVSSCGKSDENSPGVEFMPDMYRSPSLETNNKQHFMGDSMMTNRTPAPGTVARGYMPDPYQYDSAGYENAGLNMKNPLPMNDAVVAEGKILYANYCTHCHGGTGAGDGKVAAKLPGPPPAYSSPNIMSLSEGKMFYSISYGKGMMGPHAPLLSQEERWKIIHYIRRDLMKLGGSTATADSAAVGRDDAKGDTPSQPTQNTTK